MILYRLAKNTYADDLSGAGARLYGGRWNSKGKATVYLASSQSLALLELLVHLPALIEPKDYFLIEVEVPDTATVRIAIEDLPLNWNAMQPPAILKKIGDNFLAEHKYLLLKVPSAIVPNEFNYLLNIQHPDITKVKIVKKELFSFDKRLRPPLTR